MRSLLPFVRVMKYGPVNGIQVRVMIQWIIGSIRYTIIDIILDSVRKCNNNRLVRGTYDF